jgi:hypothetical protein
VSAHSLLFLNLLSRIYHSDHLTVPGLAFSGGFSVTNKGGATPVVYGFSVERLRVRPSYSLSRLFEWRFCQIKESISTYLVLAPYLLLSLLIKMWILQMMIWIALPLIRPPTSGKGTAGTSNICTANLIKTSFPATHYDPRYRIVPS